MAKMGFGTLTRRLALASGRTRNMTWVRSYATAQEPAPVQANTAEAEQPQKEEECQPDQDVAALERYLNEHNIEGATEAFLNMKRHPLAKADHNKLLQQQQRLMQSLLKEDPSRNAEKLPVTTSACFKALKFGFVHPEILTTLMLAHVRAGSPEQAIELWVRHLERFPRTKKSGKKSIQEVLIGLKDQSMLLSTILAYMTLVKDSVDADALLKLLPVNNVPLDIGHFYKTHHKLDKHEVKLINEGLSLLRRKLAIYGEQSTAAQILSSRVNVNRLYAELKDCEYAVTQEVYAAFIFRFAELKDTNKAFETWNLMKQKGTKPGSEAWAALLKAASMLKTDTVENVKAIWDAMKKQEIPLIQDSYAVYIEVLLRGGDKDAAMELYQDLKKSNSVTSVRVLNAIVNELAREGRFDEAEKEMNWALENHIEPDIVTYNTILRSAINLSEEKSAHHFYELMRSRKVKPDIVMYSHMLHMVFKYSLKQNVDMSSAVQDIISDMKLQNIKGNAQFYTIIADGLTKYSLDVGLTRKIFQIILEKDLGLSAETFGAMITAELGAGNFSAATKLFDMMPKYGIPRVASTYNQMLLGALRLERYTDAQSFFGIARKQELQEVRPNKFSYMFILSHFNKQAHPDPILKQMAEVAIEDLSSHEKMLDFSLARQVLESAAQLQVPETLVEEAKVVMNTEFDSKKRSWKPRG